ncbi:hypothetical protein ABZ320_06220, partial [Micrococcus luteus]
ARPWMAASDVPVAGPDDVERVVLLSPAGEAVATARMQATASRSTWWAPVQSQAVLRCTDAPMHRCTDGDDEAHRRNHRPALSS